MPKTHQELFRFAIDARCSVISEFYGRRESVYLKLWAILYADRHGLSLPATDDDYGIYYEDDETDIETIADLVSGVSA